MSGTTLDLDQFITPDQLANSIARKWNTWNQLRVDQIARWKELRSYIYATDTTHTTNKALPWKNTTTIPKICQIRDNLFANYIASIFPKRKWLIWEGKTEDDESQQKAAAIRDYMTWVIEQPWYRDEVTKLIYDYIDYGNCFAMTGFIDTSADQEAEGRSQIGYVGPNFQRISPLDIVFDPTAPSFERTPKIIRALVSMGEIKEMLQRESATEQDRVEAEELYQYLKDTRSQIVSYDGNITVKDDFYNVDGFGTYQSYLESDYVEVLTFYGDLYDKWSDVFYKNYVITVIDRHKIAYKKPNASYFPYAPISHSGWRSRQDNLWAMGPLENLVGMQYRLDHIENLKADLFDLTAFPPIKVSGYVEDFEWAPFEKIVTSEEGDVELMSPKVDIMTANTEMQVIMDQMELMAGAPKEAMGVRSPGEKTMFEVQRLENAAGRIFASKTVQLEEQQIERTLNGMLEQARRHMGTTVIRVIDDEFKFAIWKTLTPSDITGQGRIRPIAARHFAERAEQLQNVTNMYQSSLGQDQAVMMHFSSVKMAELIEELMDIKARIGPAAQTDRHVETFAVEVHNLEAG